MSTTKKTNGIFVLVVLLGLFAGINLVNSAWSFYIHKPGEINVVLPPGSVTINGTVSLPLSFPDVMQGGSKTVKVTLLNTYTQAVDISVNGVNTTGFSALFPSGTSIRLIPLEPQTVDLTITASETTPIGFYDITIDFFVSTV
jgi:uncharacterized membrane protein